jgi:hypothetical protein
MLTLDSPLPPVVAQPSGSGVLHAESPLNRALKQAAMTLRDIRSYENPSNASQAPTGTGACVPRRTHISTS